MLTGGAKIFSFAMHFCDLVIRLYLLEIGDYFCVCVCKGEVFKGIIYISQNKFFNILVALKYHSTFIALKYSIYITSKGALKNVILQGFFFFLNTILGCVFPVSVLNRENISI